MKKLIGFYSSDETPASNTLTWMPSWGRHTHTNPGRASGKGMRSSVHCCFVSTWDCPQDQIHYTSTQTVRLKALKHPLLVGHMCVGSGRSWELLPVPFLKMVQSWPLAPFCTAGRSWGTCFLPPQPIFLGNFTDPLRDHEAFPQVLEVHILNWEKKLCNFALKMIPAINMII